MQNWYKPFVKGWVIFILPEVDNAVVCQTVLPIISVILICAYAIALLFSGIVKLPLLLLR
jgi:hypothetical protein